MDSSLKLKVQAEAICTMLCNEHGEQSLFISVNLSNQTSIYLGSPCGKEFLRNRMNIIEQFYKHCSGQQSIVPSKKDAETMTGSTSRTIDLESAATQDAETMTESTSRTTELESAANQDAKTMTESTSRTIELESAANQDTKTVTESTSRTIDLESAANRDAEAMTESTSITTEPESAANQDAETMTESTSRTIDLESAANQDAKTMTESASKIEPESAASQDAKTMTENLEGPVYANRVIEPVSAKNNEQLKSNNSEKVIDTTSTQTRQRLSDGKSAFNKSSLKAVDKATVSQDVRTNNPKHVSVEKTNTVLSSGDLLPFGDAYISGSQSKSNKGFASVNDIKQHNNSLGDIFEGEFTDEEKSDPEFMLKSDQYLQYSLKEITLTKPNLSEESVPNAISISAGSGLRRGTRRRRPKSHFLRNDQNKYNYDYKERKTTPKKHRRRLLKVQTVLKIHPQEKDRIFDIYNSGQRIIQSVHEVKEQGTEINLPETESLETESRVLSKEIETEHVENECFVLLGLRENGFYINFEDILNQDIRRLMSEEPKQEIEQSSDGQYICPKCGQNFSSKDSAMAHIRINHTGETPFKCDICGKLFQHIRNLLSHTMLHEKDTPRIPPPAKSPLPMIIEVRNDGRYKCIECDRDFATKKWTVCHIRSKHTGQSPHMCNICNKLFARKCHLEDHMLTHNKNIRPFICEICGKTFQTKSILVTHVRTHELDGVAPSFKCPYPDCDLVFVTKLRLDKHLRNKQAGRDYVCDKCGFTTKYNHGLKNHIERIHTRCRKREFQCEQCNKYFHSKANYTVHVHKHKD